MLAAFASGAANTSAVNAIKTAIKTESVLFPVLKNFFIKKFLLLKGCFPGGESNLYQRQALPLKRYTPRA